MYNMEVHGGTACDTGPICHCNDTPRFRYKTQKRAEVLQLAELL